ncbi:MAG TPA: hypothetical protein VEY50_07820 [Lysobacter sp.]|nr:hypothetical protein [Lysobacter sp.]
MGTARPWKPPAWLIALDAVGVVLLALGLHADSGPPNPLAPYKLGLLGLGGAMMVAGALSALVLVVRHRASP